MLKYPNLFSPIRIGNAIFKNRIIAAPMGIPRSILLSSTNHGGMSLVDKSLGGAAVTTVGEGYIAMFTKTETCFDKYAIEATREIISVQRQAGGLAMVELGLFGSLNDDGSFQGPSDGKHFTGGVMKEMSQKEIRDKINDLAAMAVKSKESGFDVLMLHFGHDSLCSVFLSPVWNKRTDEYGGSIENKTRFPREAIKAVREAVGYDYPILMRVSRHLKVAESFSEDDMLYFVKSVEDYVDIVNVSCGMDCYGGVIEHYTANTYSHSTIFLPRFYNLDFASRIKKETKLLVCVVGGVSDPQDAEVAIADGKTDFVMLGRQLVADPFWPKKAQAGKDEEIVPCLRCLNCYHIATEHKNIQCSVNPRFRRENRVPLKLEKKTDKKRVVVIGGGPAGMKAALTAEECGQQVILLEKSEKLGGNLRYSDYGDFKADLRKYREYLIRHIENSQIEVRLNTEATAEYLESLQPDSLIVAVGAEFITPSIPGVEYAKQAVQVYPHLDEIKGKIVIIGGGAIGCELGIELVNRGNQVTIIEEQEALAKKSNWLYRQGLYNYLKDTKEIPTVKLETTVKEIKKDGVLIIDKNNNEESLEADHIIIAVGMKPKTDLAFSFYGITPETGMAGDCVRAAQVLEATNEAYFLAANL